MAMTTTAANLPFPSSSFGVKMITSSITTVGSASSLAVEVPANSTTITVTVLGRPNQDPYNTLAASVVSVSDQTTIFALGCRPPSLLKGNFNTYSPCIEQEATITAAPSMFAYVDADTSLGCSHASNAQMYTCRVDTSGGQILSSAFFINEYGLGGQAELLVTAGLEKLNGTSIVKSGGDRTIVDERMLWLRWLNIAVLLLFMWH
ncbi:uncharacterized protein PV09_08457 [Verruconis gallopava]|uniref:Uncharacterized protein n=1 Tax=Verruconis gallopava TaxID=253628 RepID=A0A0D2ALI5_9PEZI|nr:uncharacterized protein PV09_08457 [Verruconis gallopava]KIV99938.1 hypothetical protein PV09_08457 [Verruconis gallopava]